MLAFAGRETKELCVTPGPRVVEAGWLVVVGATLGLYALRLLVLRRRLAARRG